MIRRAHPSEFVEASYIIVGELVAAEVSVRRPSDAYCLIPGLYGGDFRDNRQPSAGGRKGQRVIVDFPRIKFSFA